MFYFKFALRYQHFMLNKILNMSDKKLYVIFIMLSYDSCYFISSNLFQINRIFLISQHDCYDLLLTLFII